MVEKRLSERMSNYGKKKGAQMKGKYLNPEDEDNNGSEDEEDEQIKATMQGGATMNPGHAATDFRKQGAAEATLEDFIMLKIVGKGTFGKVFKVQHKKTGKYYAMKCIRKDVILKNENMDSLKLEKEILYEMNHPFIVGMDYVFSDEVRIYFLMDFVEGGELFRHLVKVRRFSHHQAQFMIA